MHRSDVLEELLPGYSMVNSRRPGRTISPEEHLYIYLWFVSHEACSFRDIQNRFDVSLAEIVFIIRNVARYICSIGPKWIVWPSVEAMAVTERKVRTQSKLGGVIGFIDGTHVPIDRPNEHGDSYFNRKKTYSIQAQVVCNEAMEFIDVFVGYPGSVHDSRVFRCSDLSSKLASLPEDKHLLGDSGYPCTQQLITPFRDNGHLSRKERHFNMALSSSRVAVEHSIGILKQRFRCLYHLKLRNLKTIVQVIKSCAILHNMCMKRYGLDDKLHEELHQHSQEERQNGPGNFDNEEGAAKRRRMWNDLQK